MPGSDLPVGSVTFLFTDIEGSTPLWDQNPQAMRDSLARHNALLGEIFAAHSGLVFKVIGDAFQCVFVAPEQAIHAAIAAQHALAAADWGETGEIRVRMGIHIGKAEVRDGDYLASHTLNRVARIMSAGHGGQILLSRAISELVQAQLPGEVKLNDLGEHYLKGISHPEHIFQIEAPGLGKDFPPLVTRHSPRGYKLLEQIESGGYGAVYRAFQPEVNREVAVKIILPQYANDPDFIRRFEFEAQTVARLEHPHIVPLYDYWREPDSAYLVMRWVRGGSLAKRLEAGPLDPELVMQVVDQVSAALSAAHQQGVVHRDLNPGSILMDEGDNAYLSDFGIAKRSPGNGAPTGVDKQGGAARERSTKQPRKKSLKPARDIYSFGLVIYQMLTGERLYASDGITPQSDDHLLEALPSVRESRSVLPETVDEVIRKAITIDSNQRYADVQQLARELRASLSGLAITVSGDYEEGNIQAIQMHNPYKGLHAFQESDAEEFFGRQALIEQLLDSLDIQNGDPAKNGSGRAAGRFLAVVGPSGSGKSSVVRAGLIPSLRQGSLTGSDKWFIVDMLPGTHPMEELELSLHRVAISPVEGLMDLLNRDGGGLVSAAQMVLPEDESELLLVIDQFEELFTQVNDEDEVRHFLRNLHRAVVDANSRVRVVITLRADFYDRPLRYPEFGELIKEHTAVVLPLNVEELEQAMRGPARLVGVELEENLVTTMVADVVEQPGALPLLQYALTELFEQRQDNLLTLEGYHAISGVLGALGRRAEGVYLELSEVENQLARQVFLRLVTLGEGTEDTRRRVLRSELTGLQTQASENPGDGIGSVIEVYGRARLLSFDRDPVTRSPTVEVAHEALLREWPRLRKWLDDGRAEVRMQRVLGNVAADWLEADRDPSFLLRGARLEQFSGWVSETELALTQSEQEFMDASLAAHQVRIAEEQARRQREAALEKRSRNFLRGLVAVFALAAVVAVGLSIFAFNARDQAQSETNARATQQAIAEMETSQRATQQAIAEQEVQARSTAEAIAEEQRDQVLRQASVRLADDAAGQVNLGQPERAVLLMLAALDAFPYTPQAEKALAESVVEIANTQLFIDLGNVDWSAVAWSPEGDRIATNIYGNVVGAGSFVLLQDPQTGDEISRIPLGDSCLGPENVIWSPDGERLISVPQFCDQAPSVWDADTSELITRLDSQPDQAAFSASWSPDGERLVTGSLDGSARVWDAQSGELLMVIPAHSGEYIRGVAWSPGGDQIATASEDDTVKVWDASSGELLHELSGHTDDVFSVTWSPDGEKIATASFDATAQVWEAASGEALFSLKGHTEQVWDVAWSPDGDYIATDSRDGTARIWDSESGSELFRFRTNQAGGSVMNSIEWSPAGDRLLAMGSVYNQIWDLAAQPPNLVGHGGGLKAAEYSPDGMRIATASLDGTARIWDAANGELLRILRHSGPVEDLAWSPDGERLATTSQAGLVQVWKIASGVSSELSSLDDYHFSSLSWSPDGKRMAASSENDRASVIWDLGSGERVDLDQGDLTCFLSSPSWSPEGDRLATGCVRREVKDTPVRIWDVESGAELAQIESQDGNSLVVEWSPDGASLAVAYSEMMIKVREVGSAVTRTSFTGHSDIIADLSWSPNSQRIISADGGGFARVWDTSTSTGEEVLSFKMTNTLNSVDWSPDGTYAILATLDPQPKIQRVWQSKEALIAYAEDCCVWRPLAPGERQQFGLPLE